MTLEISLTQGKTALIDDADADLVAMCKWTAFRCDDREPELWYAKAVVCGETRVLLHRLLMGLPDERSLVDHWNGNGLDCRRENIRLCTKSQNNSHMRRMREGKTSCFHGVSFDAGKGLWRAVVSVDGRSRFIGRFRDEEDAAHARDRSAIELHGAFAVLNFPTEKAIEPLSVSEEEADICRRAAVAWLTTERARYDAVRRRPGRPPGTNSLPGLGS